MFRFHPQHRVVQEVIASGRVGEPFHIFAAFGFPPLPAGDFRWSKQMGGGALFDAGVYPIAAARMLFGEVAHRVYASWILARVEGVDIRGSAQLDFSGGRTAHVAFGFDNFYKNSYAVWGSRGHILLGRAFTVPTNHATTVTVQAEGGTETLTVDPVDQFRLMLEAFAAGLRGHAEVGLGWEEEMLGQARVVDALRRSATDGTVAYV